MTNKKIIKITNNNSPTHFKIEWGVGNLCNRKCWYCFPGSNEGTIPYPTDIELLKKNFSKLFDTYKKNGIETFEILLTGGEPTLWKEFPLILEFFRENYNVIIRTLTNGYRKLDWWKEKGKLFDHVEISVHNEHADIDHIISVADYLFSSKIMVVANVLMDPKNFDECKNIVEKLKTSKYPWPIITKTVFFDGIPKYTVDQESYFKETNKHRLPDKELVKDFYKGNPDGNRYWVTFENGKEYELPHDRWIALDKLNHFYGWKCNLGVEAMQITMDGNLTGNCMQPLYGDTEIYNILDPMFCEKFNPVLNPVICKQITCTCTTDIHFNKFK
jgi:MoaA/NifB/PqqE/SkfB family radical SAM enzyme